MKKMRKLLAGIMTAVVAASMIATIPFASASAAGPSTFDSSKDPNGDGVLNIADATYILQCLLGRYHPSDYNNLDMDNNGLVTRVDVLLTQYNTL